MPKIKLNPRQLRNLMVTFLLSFVVASPVLCQPLGISALLNPAGDIEDTDTQVEDSFVLAPLNNLENVDLLLNRGLNEAMIGLNVSEPAVLDGEDETDPAGDAGVELDLAALEAELGDISGLVADGEPAGEIDGEEPAAEATEPQPSYASVNYVLYISANQLNLRAGPSTDSAILAELKFGDTVTCVGENADWMQVTFNDLSGYVKTEYTSQTMVFREVSKTVYVKSSKLNLRAEPSTDSAILMTLTYMTKLTCTGEGDGWSKVKTATGKVGYVSSQYLTTKAATSSGSTGTAAGGSAPRNSSGNAVVDLAYSALGVRYVSGGSSMSGFDCSGLTSWCYRQVGITISRSASEYYSVGTAVSYSNIQPGDILCMDTRRSDGRTSITHVAIYVGNGMMIHASSTNHRVVLQNVSQYLSWGVKLLSVRRIAG